LEYLQLDIPTILARSEANLLLKVSQMGDQYLPKLALIKGVTGTLPHPVSCTIFQRRELGILA
jgi:hypothetical protein